MNLRELKDGELVSEKGIYVMPLKQYHGQCCVGPSVSSSGLRKIFNPDSSPAHFWLESSLNPNRIEPTETKAMILGRAAHHKLLGEPEFQKHFVERPETYEDERTGEEKPWSGNAKVCKAWLKEKAANGISVLTKSEMEMIDGMKASIEADAIAPSLLRGRVELSFIWQDSETGIWIKVRPDSIPLFDATSADLKCVSSVSDSFIHKSIDGRGYVQQAALTGDAFKELLGIDLETYSFLFVEQDKPHCFRMESVAAEDYDRGWHANRVALRLIKRCLDRNEWPGPKNRDGDGNFFNLSLNARERMDKRTARLTQELEEA
jgi:hypothetical protein